MRTLEKVSPKVQPNSQEPSTGFMQELHELRQQHGQLRRHEHSKEDREYNNTHARYGLPPSKWCAENSHTAGELKDFIKNNELDSLSAQTKPTPIRQGADNALAQFSQFDKLPNEQKVVIVGSVITGLVLLGVASQCHVKVPDVKTAIIGSEQVLSETITHLRSGTDESIVKQFLFNNGQTRSVWLDADHTNAQVKAGLFKSRQSFLE